MRRLSIKKYIALKEKIIAFVRDCQKQELPSPKWRAISRRFGITLKILEDVINDSDGLLDYNVGVRTHGGIFEFSRGEYEVEYVGNQ